MTRFGGQLEETSGRVEHIEAGGRRLLWSQVDDLIAAMAKFDGGDTSVHASASQVQDSFWASLAPPG